MVYAKSNTFGYQINGNDVDKLDHIFSKYKINTKDGTFYFMYCYELYSEFELADERIPLGDGISDILCTFLYLFFDKNNNFLSTHASSVNAEELIRTIVPSIINKIAGEEVDSVEEIVAEENAVYSHLKISVSFDANKKLSEEEVDKLMNDSYEGLTQAIEVAIDENDGIHEGYTNLKIKAHNYPRKRG